MAKRYSSEPSISDLLIATLFSSRSVRVFNSILRERQFKRYKEGSVSVALSRLRCKKYVSYHSSGWSLTRSGKLGAKNKYLFRYIPSPFKKDSSDTTIVAFDIPESKRKIRNWIRNQLKIFGYKMLQQSLWIGPGPLPKYFLERLKELNIRENVKIFSRVRKT